MSEAEDYPFGPEADELHLASDDEWETETNWWSFNVPERKMGGWFHGSVRVNKKDCTSRFFIWDDNGLHRANHVYDYVAPQKPLPDNVDLRDFTFPEGHSLKMLKPLMDYHVAFRSPDGEVSIEIEHRGIHMPHRFTRGEPPFRGSSEHFDQAGHVVGELVLRGERIPIDCYSVRDRSWGPRPVRESVSKDPARARREYAGSPSGDWRAIERHRGRGRIQYVFGTADDETGFMAFMRPQDAGTADWWPINHGYLLRDGVCAGLVKGESRVLNFRDPVSGYSSHMLVDAIDTEGRKLEAEGFAVSRSPSQNGGANALFRWFFDGKIAWGEDQDGWRRDHWEDLLRELHAIR